MVLARSRLKGCPSLARVALTDFPDRPETPFDPRALSKGLDPIRLEMHALAIHTGLSVQDRHSRANAPHLTTGRTILVRDVIEVEDVDEVEEASRNRGSRAASDAVA